MQRNWRHQKSNSWALGQTLLQEIRLSLLCLQKVHQKVAGTLWCSPRPETLGPWEGIRRSRGDEVLQCCLCSPKERVLHPMSISGEEQFQAQNKSQYVPCSPSSSLPAGEICSFSCDNKINQQKEAKSQKNYVLKINVNRILFSFFCPNLTLNYFKDLGYGLF